MQLTRISWAWLIALGLSVTLASPASGVSGSDSPIYSRNHAFLCAPADHLARPLICSNYGPGAYAYKLQSVELPFTLPSLPVSHPDERVYPVVAGSYARAAPHTQVYSTPASDGDPVREMGIRRDVGYIFVSIEDTIQNGGESWAQIGASEYVNYNDLIKVQPSSFQGVLITSTPRSPLVWIVRAYHPRKTPGSEVESLTKLLLRYQLKQVFADQSVDGRDWYLLGRDQWVEQRNVGMISVSEPPDGVQGRWIDVNLYEQTLTAYEDEKPIYATLVSTGFGEWTTRTGLFQVYLKLDRDDMGGAFAADQSDYYYIEDVPWVMYFDGAIALHGAYWHDSFGFQKSHGCVNLAPHDARWLYEWSDKGTWVWVHDRSLRPSGSVEVG